MMLRLLDVREGNVSVLLVVLFSVVLGCDARETRDSRNGGGLDSDHEVFLDRLVAIRSVVG
jgi:hypothetical protein